MTVGDVMEETGATDQQVRAAYKAVGEKPITPRERSKMWLLAEKDKMTIGKFCKKYGFTFTYVNILAKELGVSFLDSSVPPTFPVNSENVTTVDTIHTTISQRLNTVGADPIFSRRQAREYLRDLFDKKHGRDEK